MSVIGRFREIYSDAPPAHSVTVDRSTPEATLQTWKDAIVERDVEAFRAVHDRQAPRTQMICDSKRVARAAVVTRDAEQTAALRFELAGSWPQRQDYVVRAPDSAVPPYVMTLSQRGDNWLISDARPVA